MPPVLTLPTVAVQVYCTLSSDIHNPTISTAAVLYKYVPLGQIKKICCCTTCSQPYFDETKNIIAVDGVHMICKIISSPK